MRKYISVLALLIFYLPVSAQKPSLTLTVEKIMRDPKWMGASPSSADWSHDGKYLFFQWNPETAPSDSLYYITVSDRIPQKANSDLKKDYNVQGDYVYNTNKNAYVVVKNGDIYFTDEKTGKTKRITQTTEAETNARFCFNDTRIVYNKEQNLYSWDIATGETVQLTNIKSGDSGGNFQRGGNNNSNNTTKNPQEQWLKKDQLQYFQVLRERKEKKEATDAYNKSIPKEKELTQIDISDKRLIGLGISPDGRFVNYRLFKQATSAKSTIVPNYVTESGFTTDIPSRSKVGAAQGTSEYYIYDRLEDTVITINTDSIPGISDLPDYVKDYPVKTPEKNKKSSSRSAQVVSLSWSPKGDFAVLDIHSDDNKDRWLMLFEPGSKDLKLLDRQRDEAWIGGPGTSGFGSNNTGWLNDQTFWYRSETTGYSHLYSVNVKTGDKKAITGGKYEVQQAQLSADKKYFYITTNEVHPGEQHFYKLSISDGKKEKITSMTGANRVSISPDEKWLAILYSYSNKPWELYLQENKRDGKTWQITDKAQSDEFKSYAWRDPEVITFRANDGAEVYARLYKPANPDPHKPAVLFVHGAGYLQNAHKWWSSYFREYMFNNLLVDKGYYVMDIDYRGSAGYGRDWRTGIYRHMGGKDLSDQVDAVNYLVKNFGVDPKRIGIYGGSYGGFITLMALFTEPDVFAAGAALRPVTDWANYNHGYTSNILNEPYNDSLAYKRSSPLYFAEGLKGHLLICHGMIDVNVHYQDAVKLTQRLIELGKDNWELASYPLEDHGFVEPSSWMDEYKRILKLFETELKK